MSFYYKPYVPVGVRRVQAARKVAEMKKKGMNIQPIEIQGRKIARTFWGEAWCEHLEKFSDYANRLPRGRTYVRNGSVCHLDIEPGSIKAIVSGSDLYNITIEINKLNEKKWSSIKKKCSGKINSLLELLQGKLSSSVMSVVTDRKTGIFPSPKQIHMDCDCPDWAGLCKHLAAVLYGIGVRLDDCPELLFRLRGVDHEQLVDTDINIKTSRKQSSKRALAKDDLAGIFDIELDEMPAPRKKAVKKTVRKKTAKKTIANACPETGTAVCRLRKSFDLTPSEFARLLGVSETSINNWENRKGKLNLQNRTREKLSRAASLSKSQAQKKIRK